MTKQFTLGAVVSREVALEDPVKETGVCPPEAKWAQLTYPD